MIGILAGPRQVSSRAAVASRIRSSKLGTVWPGVADVRSFEHRLLDGQASGSTWRAVVVRRHGIDRVEVVVGDGINDLRVLPGPGRLLRSRGWSGKKSSPISRKN